MVKSRSVAIHRAIIYINGEYLLIFMYIFTCNDMWAAEYTVYLRRCALYLLLWLDDLYKLVIYIVIYAVIQSFDSMPSGLYKRITSFSCVIYKWRYQQENHQNCAYKCNYNWKSDHPLIFTFVILLPYFEKFRTIFDCSIVRST